MYRFTGFFAKSEIEQPASLPAGAVWRNVSGPFSGVGVSLRNLDEDKPGLEEARRLLAEIGLRGATVWLFINYVTWAGRIDSVYGLEASGDRVFGPIDESDLDKVQAAYLELMGAFGVSATDAMRFPPFVRGFWGE